MEKLAISIDELADALGVSRPVAYQIAKRQDFPAVKLNRRIIVPLEALKRWLDKQAAEEAE